MKTYSVVIAESGPDNEQRAIKVHGESLEEVTKKCLNFFAIVVSVTEVAAMKSN